MSAVNSKITGMLFPLLAAVVMTASLTESTAAQQATVRTWVQADGCDYTNASRSDHAALPLAYHAGDHRGALTVLSRNATVHERGRSSAVVGVTLVGDAR